MATIAMESSQALAAARTFGTYELLEHTLLKLPPSDLLRCQRVSSQCQVVIREPPNLQQRTYLQRLGRQLFLTFIEIITPVTGTITSRGHCVSWHIRGKRCARRLDFKAADGIDRIASAALNPEVKGDRLMSMVGSALTEIYCRDHDRRAGLVDQICSSIEEYRLQIPSHEELREVRDTAAQQAPEEGKAWLEELKWQGMVWERLMIVYALLVQELKWQGACWEAFRTEERTRTGTKTFNELVSVKATKVGLRGKATETEQTVDHRQHASFGDRGIDGDSSDPYIGEENDSSFDDLTMMG